MSANHPRSHVAKEHSLGFEGNLTCAEGSPQEAVVLRKVRRMVEPATRGCVRESLGDTGLANATRRTAGPSALSDGMWSEQPESSEGFESVDTPVITPCTILGNTSGTALRGPP